DQQLASPIAILLLRCAGGGVRSILSNQLPVESVDLPRLLSTTCAPYPMPIPIVAVLADRLRHAALALNDAVLRVIDERDRRRRWIVAVRRQVASLIIRHCAGLLRRYA